MCHKERKMGTMVERIEPVSPASFLYSMLKIFANTSNALTPRNLRIPFGAPHESTGFCGWVSSTGKWSIHTSNWKGGRSISPTEKGPVHIPNQKGALQKAWIRAPYQKWPKKMPLPPHHKHIQGYQLPIKHMYRPARTKAWAPTLCRPTLLDKATNSYYTANTKK